MVVVSWFVVLYGGARRVVPLVEVNIGLLADEVGVAAADTLDLGQGVHDLLLSINVGVEKTQDELEVRFFAGHNRLFRQTISIIIPVSPRDSIQPPGHFP